MPNGNCIDSLPEFLKPKLRLFLSVDIVGSTAFKQSSKDKEDKSKSLAPEWLVAITTFYREIERLFIQEYKTLSHSLEVAHGWTESEAPILWKAAGDELIYTAKLNDHKHAFVYVASWMNATSKFRSEIKKFSKGLDLKLTAWIAGFPILNSELMLRQNGSDLSLKVDEDDSVLANFQLLEKFQTSNKDLIIDYIGPSLDTGFRLTAYATPRKFIISVDLALILSHILSTPPNTSFPNELIVFRYDEKKSLKGVLDGIPYPIFWIDNDPKNKLNILEDSFAGNNQIGVAELRDYCMTYIGSLNSERLILPYIKGDTDAFFRTIPESHSTQLNKLVEYWEKETEKRKIETDSAAPPCKEQTTTTNNSNDFKSALSAFQDMLKIIKKPPNQE